VTYARVETAETLQPLLDDRHWDLIISDHGLPQFSAPEALRLVRNRGLDLPFIIVSGSIGEDIAVAAMRAGASDYLVKGNLARLVPAVHREIREAQQRRQSQLVEQTLRQTEGQLRQAQKMEAMGQLAGGIAHDFNNLLTAILGFSQFLLEDSSLNGAQRADLEEIHKAGERAATLTRQLLAFSRQQVLEPRVVDLNETVGGVQRLLARVIGADIKLVTETEPHLARAKVDPGQIEQILMNLAVNARDAMPTGGRLTIQTANYTLSAGSVTPHAEMGPGRYTQISMSDTGAGMSPEIKSRIFEPFFTTKEAGKGTGLGLSTVYGIVTQSGGQITVHSEPGRGTRFDIYLPSVDEVVDAPRTRPAETGKAAGVETILLVDDERGIRELFRRTLESKGYRVLIAADGQEALVAAKACSGRVDLLITDVVMPRMGGADLATELMKTHPSLRVLYISGYLDHRASHVTATDVEFLRKPFTPTDLLRKTRQILSSVDEREGS
jgi:signal transduction histidine kinase